MVTDETAACAIESLKQDTAELAEKPEEDLCDEYITAFSSIVPQYVVCNPSTCLPCLVILDSFNWNVGLPTAAHFIDYILSVAVSIINFI